MVKGIYGPNPPDKQGKDGRWSEIPCIHKPSHQSLVKKISP
jgi:hypothetical protein